LIYLSTMNPVSVFWSFAVSEQQLELIELADLVTKRETHTV